MSKIKPCPFCGSSDIELIKIGNDFTKSRSVEIKCNGCHVISIRQKALHYNHDWLVKVVIGLWNNRKMEDEILEALKELSSSIQNAEFHPEKIIPALNNALDVIKKAEAVE